MMQILQIEPLELCGMAGGSCLLLLRQHSLLPRFQSQLVMDPLVPSEPQAEIKSPIAMICMYLQQVIGPC